MPSTNYHRLLPISWIVSFAVCVINSVLIVTPLHAQNATASTFMELATVIKATQSAILSSQMTGVITDVNHGEGDMFKKGDELLKLDCSLQKSSLKRARAEVEYSRNEYRSVKSLEKLNSATKVQVARSAAEFAKAMADLDTAIYSVSQCDVIAPFDGTVTKSWAKPFESIQTGEKLVEIVNNGSLIVEFLVPSKALATLETGKRFSLHVSETGHDYPARIEKIIPFVDSISQTVKVISTLESIDSDLWSGMSGTAVFQ